MLWACGAGEVPEEPLQIPEVDGEAWDANIELGRPGHRIQIRADYLREFSKSERVVATGGVEVAFRGDEAVSTLRAERMVLEHKRDRFGLAGGVVLRAGDSLEVQADTLLWGKCPRAVAHSGDTAGGSRRGTGVGAQSHEQFRRGCVVLGIRRGPLARPGRRGRGSACPARGKAAESRVCRRSPTTASRCATTVCN